MNTIEPKQIPPGSTAPESENTQSSSKNPVDSGVTGGVRGSANVVGACSIEVGCGCSFGNLSYTHEDATGFFTYLEQWHPRNFWFADCGVKPWIYYEPYDNWQDIYGIDAVLVFYHSGHGGMDGNGVFYLPMSAPWGNEGCTVVSNSDNMQLGNERVRYIFWSTCCSVRVLDGQNPINTWHKSNRGWRMMFGFETTSWDSTDYGSNFFKKWKDSGYGPWSTAWLEGSWAIAHDQAPSVVACGATPEEAQNRLFYENKFYWESVSNAWYWWRWYYASASLREPLLVVPQNLMVARLQSVAAAQQSAQTLANRFQLDIDIPTGFTATADGSYQIGSGEKSIAYGSDGSINVQFAKANRANRTPLAEQRVTALAQEAVWRYGLDEQVPVVLDQIVSSLEAGGAGDGSGQIEGPYTTATIVQFRQLINGIPVITPDAGTVRISIDNDGTVTNVHSSVRAIEQLSSRPTKSVTAPIPEGFSATPTLSPEPNNYEQQLAAAFSKQAASWVTKGGSLPLEFTTVPDSTEIGYDIRGDNAVLIARKAVEVNFGSGYRKRYWVTVSLFE
jgi:hypothetical protein